MTNNTDNITKLMIYFITILIFILIYQVKKEFSYYNNKDFIVFLNVGSGDSILIGSKNIYALVDGGPSTYSTNRIFKYTLNKYPSAYFVTHNHSDHISGLIKLLEYRTNYDLFLNKQNYNSYESDLVQHITYKNILIKDKAILGNFTIKVLFPNNECTQTNVNLCSLVLLVTHKNGKKILLTGDLESSMQYGLVSSTPQVEILKYPHHGADNGLNKNFIKAIKPKYAVISVGENDYGHPSNKVIDYLKNQNISVLRTDEQGDIVFLFD